jgi:thiosulfate/3-mercaptopyruvate sulfurtransferase
MSILVRTRGSLGESLVTIDARPETFYRGNTPGQGVGRAGHIPGAINIPWSRNLTSTNDDALFRSPDELRSLYSAYKIGRGTTVITYCRTGVEASMTYFVLRYLGLDPVLYDGSFIEWSNSGATPVV